MILVTAELVRCVYYPEFDTSPLRSLKRKDFLKKLGGKKKKVYKQVVVNYLREMTVTFAGVVEEKALTETLLLLREKVELKGGE